MLYLIGVFIGAYIILSLIFLCFPNIIHKRKQYRSEILEESTSLPGNKTLLVAHRGGARERLENTIEAFEYAVDKGCHILEMDVHLTKDNVVVVSHDADLKRQCGKSVKISELLYEELPPLANEVEIHFTEGVKFKNDNPNARLPTLKEVFEKLPNTIMHIDLKGDSPLLPLETYKLVKSCEREHITVLGGVNQKKINELKKMDSSLITFCSATSYLGVFLLYMIGLLPFVGLGFNFFSVAKYTVDFDRIGKNPNIPKPGAFKVFTCLLKFLDFISAPLFRHLQKRGVIVLLWVLNDPVDFKDALNKKVNGIMTDVPSVCREYLDFKNKYLSSPTKKTPLLY